MRPVSPRIPHAIGVLAIALLVVCSAGAVTASPGAVVDGQLDSGDGGGVVAQEGESPPEPANNSTQHEHPDEASEQGDTDQLRSWLHTQLSQQLRDSTVKLSEGEYEQARSVIGDDYNDMLSKYVEVEGETSGGESTAAEFEEAQDEQTEYVDTVASYRDTLEAYQEAKAEGNETRARELARNLSRQADRVESLSGNLTESYDTIENRTGVTLADEEAIIRNTTRNISEQQREIVAAEFIQTSLRVAASGELVSFSEPLRMTGWVQNETGAPVRNESATILVGEHSYAVDLDEEGRFEILYRPIRLRVDSTAITVRYRPRDSSPYLGSNTTVPVSVEQTTPSVAVTLNRSEAGYGDVVRVTSTVMVGEQAVPGVRVGLALGNRSVGTAAITDAGTMTRLIRIGAGVPAGAQSVAATAGWSEAAIGRAQATTDLTVVETPTTLDLSARVDGDRVRITGRLQTTDGDPIPGQTVDVAVTDQQVFSAETNASGYFVAHAPLDLYESGTTPELSATYRGVGTNLEAASATARVTIPEANQAPIGLTPLVLGGGVLLFAVAGGWVVLRRRRGGSTRSDVGASSDEASSGGGTASASVDPSGLRRAVGAALSRHRAGDDAEAVVVLYPAIRAYLTERYDLPATGTHWEFYRVVVDDADAGEWGTVVERVTEAYETVRFAETAVDAEGVRVILDRLDERLDEIAGRG